MTDPPRNREEFLAAFEATRDKVNKITDLVRRSCGQTDMKRAAATLGVLAAGKFLIRDQEPGIAMIRDIAIFEPNDHGVRPMDRFLSGPARALPKDDQDIAQSVGRAFFSLFKFTTRHELGGIWVEDILDNDRPIWIANPLFEDRDGNPEIFAMRIFDTGPFHTAIGIVTQASAKMVEICTISMKDTGRLPFRQSLAATLYGVSLMDGQPRHPSGMKFARELYPVLKAFEYLADTKPARSA